MKIPMTWEEICADPVLRALPHKIEQDRYGRILMTPPPDFPHGRYQVEIVFLLKLLLQDWVITGDCPVPTAEGVRAPDVAALRKEHAQKQGRRWQVLSAAPALCVEVLSPSNSFEEMEEKRRLLAGAGCEEFWTCSEDGQMSFFAASGAGLQRSALCPDFPGAILLD